MISWYHLAFFVISIAMFGLTAGAMSMQTQLQVSSAVPRRPILLVSIVTGTPGIEVLDDFVHAMTKAMSNRNQPPSKSLVEVEAKKTRSRMSRLPFTP